MTPTPDSTPNPEDPDDRASSRKLDEDAAWRAIIENYGPEPTVEDPPAEPPSPRVLPDLPATRRDGGDSLNTGASWDDEGHFVPPVPPPMPPLEPRRKLAWLGLFGAPTLMLVAVVLGWSLADIVMGFLVCWFVGGFAFLVATMPRSRGGDGPDDGAVV